MSLNQLFSKYSKEEKVNLLKMGLFSSNTPIMEYITKSKQKINLNQNDIFMVCRQGSSRSLDYLKGKVDLKNHRQIITGNTCAHIAGEYGNLEALSYLKKINFDFATLNFKHETALIHTLKNNQRNFGPTVGFLGKQTPIGIRDADNNFSYQVNIPLDQSKARLLEWLKQRQSGN